MAELLKLTDQIPDGELGLTLSQAYPGVFQFISPQAWFDPRLSSHGRVLRRQMVLEVIDDIEGDLWITHQAHQALEMVRKRYDHRDIPGLGSELKPFQSYVVNTTLGVDGEEPKRFCLWDLDMGVGKGFMSLAVMQELIANLGLVDLAVFFTTKINKKEFKADLDKFTTLTSIVLDGPKDKRPAMYRSGVQVMISNYEKAKFDTQDFLAAVRGKRVAWFFDEAHGLVASPTPTQTRRGLDKLLRATAENYIYPQSGTIIEKDPERYWRMFQYAQDNPFGGVVQFRLRYSDGSKRIDYGRGHLREVTLWNEDKLKEAPLLVQDHSIALRKTDRGIREYFQYFPVEPIYIDMSPEDRVIYDAIWDDLEENAEDFDPSTLADYINTLSVLCSAPGGIRNSQSTLGTTLVDVLPQISNENSSKMAAVASHVERILEENQKVILFTHWTNMVLLPLSEYFDSRGIKHLVHHGGMTEKRASEAIKSFKEDESQKVLLSSDAGAHALSLDAKYVISIECPRSADLLDQRNARIHRLTSKIANPQAFVYLTRNTIEDKIYAEMMRRRALSNSMQGTQSSDSSTISIRDILNAR